MHLDSMQPAYPHVRDLLLPSRYQLPQIRMFRCVDVFWCRIDSYLVGLMSPCQEVSHILTECLCTQGKWKTFPTVVNSNIIYVDSSKGTENISGPCSRPATHSTTVTFLVEAMQRVFWRLSSWALVLSFSVNEMKFSLSKWSMCETHQLTWTNLHRAPTL